VVVVPEWARGGVELNDPSSCTSGANERTLGWPKVNEFINLLMIDSFMKERRF